MKEQNHGKKVIGGKKVKNKGWAQQQQIYEQQQIKETDHGKGKYKNISQMGSKYSFNVQSVLGEGFGSSVYLGKRIADSLPVCVKAVDFMAFGSQDSPYIDLIHQEIKSLKKFQNSEYIVNLHDVYESATFFYLVMELCQGGDLYKVIKMAPFPLPIYFVQQILQQIVHGLMIIHENELIHRDLKTQNILVISFPNNPTQKMKVKIGDLGFCITQKELNQMHERNQKALNLGSPIYMSPEVCQDHKYSYSSDIYAVGIIWYELLHKVAPWQALNEEELLDKKLTTPINNWRQDVPEKQKLLIAQCLSLAPQERPSCKDLLQYFQQNKSEFQKVKENTND